MSRKQSQLERGDPRTGGDEAIHGLIDIINSGVTCDVLQRAVQIHPTVSELIPILLSEMKPAE